MFGVIRPCRNRLGDRLSAQWMAHLCGMCLTLRDECGQLARLVTNVDAVVISALVEAQRTGTRRTAGPCPLRGMRRASVTTGQASSLAAAASLVLASAKLADHVSDGDVAGARALVSTALASRWGAAGAVASRSVGLDARALLSSAGAQQMAEASASSLLHVTAPAEAATAAVFRHTAVLAGAPHNVDVLAQAGALFGRLAHVLDAVSDLRGDRTAAAWNPLAAFAIDPPQARSVCDDALLGIRLALAEAQFVDDALVHALLVHELSAAVDRVFAEAGARRASETDEERPDWPLEAPPQSGSGLLAGCLGWLVACGTCQVCCRDTFTDPCTGKQRHGACSRCNDADGCDGCGSCLCDGCCDSCDDACCDACCDCPC